MCIPQTHPKTLASHAGQACFFFMGIFLFWILCPYDSSAEKFPLIYHNFSLVGLPYPTSARDADTAGVDGQHSVKYH